MSTDKIMLIKEKIIGWLKEEACSPVEQTDPNAYFNIAIKVGRMGCQVVQPVRKMDSLMTVVRLPLPPEMLQLVKSMEPEKKTALFWDLRLSILKNSELLEFKIESDSPEDIKAVALASRPIFYEELTKSKLFSAIYAVTRATLMVMLMLQKYAGKIPSKKDQKLPYSS
jgi:hypothetical protein